MSDPVDPMQSRPAARGGEAEGFARPGEGAFPWDEEVPGDPETAPEGNDAARERHDAFTEARKAVYLRALVKTGGIQDACRLTGISPRTVYRHQERDLGVLRELPPRAQDQRHAGRDHRLAARG